MPLLSIVVPVYNVEKEIHRCINSLLSQNLKDCELIFVDDGSTDSSGVIADSFRNENILVIHKENGGLSSARTEGLKYAKGEYVWFIDSDDAVESNSIQEITEYLQDFNPDILHFGYKLFIGERYSGQPPFFREKMYRGAALDGFRHQLFHRACASMLPVWGNVYRRELIETIPMVSERKVYAEDIVFNILAFTKAESIYCSSELWYRYYIRQGSLTYSGRTMLREYLYAYRYLKQQLQLSDAWETYKQDISLTYLMDGILGVKHSGGGCIAKEYALNPDKANAHETVRAALQSEEMADMLKNTQDIPFAPIQEDLRNIVKAGNEEILFMYLAKLFRKG